MPFRMQRRKSMSLQMASYGPPFKHCWSSLYTLVNRVDSSLTKQSAIVGFLHLISKIVRKGGTFGKENRRVKPGWAHQTNNIHRWPQSQTKKCPKFKVQHHKAGNKETIKCPSPKNILIFPSSFQWSWSGLWDAPYKMRRNDLQLPSTWRMQWFHVPSRTMKSMNSWTWPWFVKLWFKINISRGLLFLMRSSGSLRGCKKRRSFFLL